MCQNKWLPVDVDVDGYPVWTLNKSRQQVTQLKCACCGARRWMTIDQACRRGVVFGNNRGK